MLRTLLLFITAVLVDVAWGQSYNYYYWMDNNTTAANYGSTTGEKQFDVNIASLKAGLHLLHIQAQQPNRGWSSVRTLCFIKNEQNAATAARYWIDNDPATLHDGVATSGVIDLDIAALKAGFHVVHYQTYNAKDEASSARTLCFIKSEQDAATTARYWIDNDPATLHNGVTTNGIIDLDIAALKSGLHVVHYQTFNAKGDASSVRTLCFIITEQSTTARYWIDNDPTTLHDGVAIDGIIDLDISKLGVGLHVVHYQAFDAKGVASAVRTKHFFVDQVQIGTLTANIGIDDGEAVNYALSEEDIEIDISELAEGTHELNVTLLDGDGITVGQEVQEFEIIREQPSPAIEFADATVKSICVEHWDTNGDGELSEDEAAAVTELGGVFRYNNNITSFDELHFFIGLTGIGDYEFDGCFNLESVIFPNTLQTIGSCAFYNCNLASVAIPYGVTTLGHSAFRYCDELESVIIPNSVETIGYDCFEYCYKLTSISIPSSVTNIGDAAMSGCSSLQEIIVDAANQKYTSSEGVLYNKEKTILLSYPAGKTDLEFAIPSNVTVISSHAFYYCKILKSVTIHENVTSIGWYAFVSDTPLTSITVKSVEPIALGEERFGSNTEAAATLYVPYGSKTKYQQANDWKNFQNIVEMGTLSGNIDFADATVKSICVEHWDADGDGELSYEEAAAVTELDGAFSSDECYSITSFDELQYFTGLTAIEGWDMNGMNGLESIIIPQGVMSIDVNTFLFMYNLESIQVVEANTVYDSRNNCNAIIETATNKLIKGLSTTVIPSSVTTIGNMAFFNNSWNGTLPDGLETIEEEAFYSCKELDAIVIPASVTSIGENAFCGCNLTSITVDARNTVYDSRNNCNALIETSTNTLLLGTGSTVIPTSVTAIGNSAFDGCNSTAAIVVPDNVMTIGESAFSGSKFSSITLPAGLTTISKHMMSLCYNLTEIEIPSEVTSIGYYAFYADKNVTSITIPSKVKSIGEGAFSYCDKLASVSIPASVTSIAKNAFLSSMNLVNVEVGMITPITIDATVFPNRANATLYVPAGTKSLYENAPYWKEFNEIVEIVDIVSGDANGDGDVNVTDYMAIANYILGLNPANFNATAADVNGDNDVNVTDYVGVANIILYGNYQGSSVNSVMALGAEGTLPWMEIGLTDDGKMNLLLHDTKPFSAFQMDIRLPEGVEIVEANMAKANQTRNLGFAKLQDGTWRLLYGTLENKAVNLVGDNLLTLELATSQPNAGGLVIVDDIFVTDRYASTLQLNAVQSGLPTGINSIERGTVVKGDSYDLTGRKINNGQLSKGVYIVNGKITFVK